MEKNSCIITTKSEILNNYSVSDTNFCNNNFLTLVKDRFENKKIENISPYTLAKVNYNTKKVVKLSRDESMPENFVPIRFFDNDNNLVREFYVNPNKDIYLTFDTDVDTDTQTRLLNINYSNKEDIICKGFRLENIADFEPEIDGLEFLGYNVESDDVRVNTGRVETENILLDGEKNFYPVYKSKANQNSVVEISKINCEENKLYIDFLNNLNSDVNLEKILLTIKESTLFSSSTQQKVVCEFDDIVVNKNEKFRTQLEFVCDKNELIIGNGLAKNLTFGEKTKLRFVTFDEMPTNQNVKMYDQNMPKLTLLENSKTIKFDSTELKRNCVGYGVADSNNNLCFIVNHTATKGDKTKNIYLQIM